MKPLLRSVLAPRSFSALVILTLALGIGASSTVFSVVDAVWIRPLPYPAPERLVRVFAVNPAQRISQGGMSWAALRDLEKRLSAVAAVGGQYEERLTEVSGALPEQVLLAWVTPGFFPSLGIQPERGKLFLSEELAKDGGSAGVVISERFWRKRFGANPNLEGLSVRFSKGGTAVPVYGVLPPRYSLAESDPDLYRIPDYPAVMYADRKTRFFSSLARLREGVSVERAREELAALQTALAGQFGADEAGWSYQLEPLEKLARQGSEAAGGSSRPAALLAAAVGMLLLIACTNVTCLLLAQGAGRSREFAVRLSLGASRATIAWQLLREALVLAVGGAALGLLFAAWGIEAFRLYSASIPRIEAVSLDWRVLLFALGLSVATTLLFSLAPVWQASRTDIGRGLSARPGVGQAGKLPFYLVSAQMAMTLVLLLGAGLLLRTMDELSRIEPGFDPAPVLSFRITASWGETGDMPRVRQRLLRTLEELQAIPGVQHAALATGLPASGKIVPSEFQLPGEASFFAAARSVSPQYFQTLGMPILQGATCKEGEGGVLVNSSFARKHFGSRSALGRDLRPKGYGNPKAERILGVVGDVREEVLVSEAQPMVYFCGTPGFWPDPYYFVRVAGSPLAAAEPIRRLLARLAPNRSVYDVKEIRAYLDSTEAQRRFQAQLLSAFAGLALVLAAAGLFGVMCFAVSQRTRELGLRLALGARPAAILAGVLRQGLTFTAIGWAAGGVAALLAREWISSFLYGVKATDPLAVAGVLLTLLLSALLAAWIPAWRASRVDPMVALRVD
jgi:putative ABC transport system permease protein